MSSFSEVTKKTVRKFASSCRDLFYNNRGIYEALHPDMILYFSYLAGLYLWESKIKQTAQYARVDGSCLHEKSILIPSLDGTSSQ